MYKAKGNQFEYLGMGIGLEEVCAYTRVDGWWGVGDINEFGGLDLLNRYAVVNYAVQLLFMVEENSN